jgi:hypothetical protein
MQYIHAVTPLSFNNAIVIITRRTYQFKGHKHNSQLGANLTALRPIRGIVKPIIAWLAVTLIRLLKGKRLYHQRTAIM